MYNHNINYGGYLSGCKRWFCWLLLPLCCNPFCKWFWSGCQGYLNTWPDKVLGVLGLIVPLFLGKLASLIPIMIRACWGDSLTFLPPFFGWPTGGKRSRWNLPSKLFWRHFSGFLWICQIYPNPNPPKLHQTKSWLKSSILNPPPNRKPPKRGVTWASSHPKTNFTSPPIHQPTNQPTTFCLTCFSCV